MLQCVGALQSLSMHAALEWGRTRRAALRQMAMGMGVALLWRFCSGAYLHLV